jgi:hypothetical protein
LLSETHPAFDRTADRRARLKTTANPAPEHDLLVTVRQTTGAALTVDVRYVPDKRILDVAASETYWRLADLDDQSPESVAATVLADFNNELVPRWIQVVASEESRGHQAAVTDRQPNWDNPHLLDRLRRL